MEVIVPWNDGNGNIIVTITYEEEGYDGVLTITSDSAIGDTELRTQVLTLVTTDGSNVTAELTLTQIGKYVQVYTEEVVEGNEVYENNDYIYVEATGNEYTNYGPLSRAAVTMDSEGTEVILTRIDEEGNLRSTC